MRAAPLTTIKGGINRLRTKGGARADNLYDLVNGYVTEAGTVKVRPGTVRMATLDPLTRGICTFDGSLYTFCHKQVAVPDGFLLAVVAHPDPPDSPYYDDPLLYAADNPLAALEKIHFAEPFLGGLYIVAEFADESTYHYWLQPAGSTWAAETAYAAGALVEPTVPNGFVYQATRYGDPYPAWEADALRTAGDAYYTEPSRVEPTVANGFYYECIDTDGPNPRSGTVEPTWPTEEGLTVIERVDTTIEDETTIDGSAPPTTAAPLSPTDGGGSTDDRYNSGGVTGPNAGTIDYNEP
jgi:hypothetical protein